MILTILTILTIAADVVARILRHHFGDNWPIGTIAKHLGVHHDTVKRVVGQADITLATVKPPHPSKLAPFFAFMLETLVKYPALRAKRLYAMVCELGYKGGPDHFHRRALAAAQGGRGVPTPAHAAGRAGPGRLGALWHAQSAGR